MLKALESLPWVRQARVDFANKQASITVVTKSYDEKQLVKTLKDAGFGASVAKKGKGDEKEPVVPPDSPKVAFQVSGMKKTKSGAT